MIHTLRLSDIEKECWSVNTALKLGIPLLAEMGLIIHFND